MFLSKVHLCPEAFKRYSGVSARVAISVMQSDAILILFTKKEAPMDWPGFIFKMASLKIPGICMTVIEQHRRGGNGRMDTPIARVFINTNLNFVIIEGSIL